jgi:hypothetical protein
MIKQTLVMFFFNKKITSKDIDKTNKARHKNSTRAGY